MKFIVSSSALLKHLQQISGVISANTVLPILEDFLFEVEKNKLTIVATDLETVMKVHMEVEARETGKVCIPAKILLDSLKNTQNPQDLMKIQMQMYQLGENLELMSKVVEQVTSGVKSILQTQL